MVQVLITDFESPARQPASSARSVLPNGLGLEGWWDERRAGASYDGSYAARLRQESSDHSSAYSYASYEYLSGINVFARGAQLDFKPFPEGPMEFMTPSPEFPDETLVPGMAVRMLWRIGEVEGYVYTRVYQDSFGLDQVRTEAAVGDESVPGYFTQFDETLQAGRDIYQWLRLSWKSDGNWTFGPRLGSPWASGNVPAMPSLADPSIALQGFQVTVQPDARVGRSSSGALLDNVYVDIDAIEGSEREMRRAFEP